VVRFHLTVAVAISLLSVSCTRDGSSAEPRQPPRLAFTETTHALGHVKAGRQVTYAYTFRNAGGLDLSIDNVRAACSCTAAVPPKRAIPPGGDGTIDVTFDTTREHGHVARTITVYSNDPAQPVTTLTLVADIDAVLAADPPQLYIGHVHRGEPASNSVRLVSTEPSAVATIETTGKVVDATISGTVSAGTPRQLRVAVKPNAPLGRFKESILVHTQDAQQPLLTIPVVGIVDADDTAAATERR
jgi:hypothetical protein